MGLWSSKVNEEPRDSTNSGLIGSWIGTWRRAKSLSGSRLEKAARMVVDAKTAQELHKRMARLGGCRQSQPVTVGRAGWAKMHRECPAMNASARQSLLVPEQGQKRGRSNGYRRASVGSEETVAQPMGAGGREANLGCSSRPKIACCGKRCHGCW